MKIKSTILKTGLVIIIAFALVCIGYFAFLSLRLETLYSWQENILSYGPWSSQAIWMSEDRKVYLYCEKAPEDSLATVVASVQATTNIITCTPELHYGSKILDFYNPDGNILFTCKIDLIGKETLKLYDMDNIADILVNSEIQKAGTICLTKFPYDASLQPSTK